MKYYIKIFVFAIYLFVASHTSAQKNLVPNWSFEEYNVCPDYTTCSCQLPTTTITSVNNWFCFFTSNTSPDYFNQCGIPIFFVPNNGFGFQLPKTGSSYMGSYLWARGLPFNNENIEIKLIDSLKKKHKLLCNIFC
jgi:hypothetical protein